MSRRLIIPLGLALATPVALPAAEPLKPTIDKRDSKAGTKRAPGRGKVTQPSRPAPVPSLVDMNFFFPI